MEDALDPGQEYVGNAGQLFRPHEEEDGKLEDESATSATRSKQEKKTSAPRRPLLTERSPLIRGMNPLNIQLQRMGFPYVTAQVTFPANYDPKSHESSEVHGPGSDGKVFLDVLHHFDETFFDDSSIPRCCWRCCPKWLLKPIELLAGGLGAGAIVFSMGPFANGEFDHMFHYAVDGGWAYFVFISTAVLNAPPALLIFYNLARNTLEKARSSFKPPTSSSEEEGNCHYARCFKKTLPHRVLDLLLFPAAFVYGMQPAFGFIKAEESFPYYGIPMSIPLLFYFSVPFFNVGRQILETWYANTFYTNVHLHKETRRAFVAALRGIQTAIEKDKKGDFTIKVWALLQDSNVSKLSILLSKPRSIVNNPGEKEVRRAFVAALNGLQTVIQDDELRRRVLDLLQDSELLRDPNVSELRDLLMSPRSMVHDPEGEEELAPHYNRTAISVGIKEPTRSEKVASWASKFLTGASLIPGYMTESYFVSSTLSLTPFPPLASQVTGYILAGFFATRLPIEQEMHRQNALSLSHPLSLEVKDHKFVRGALGVKSVLFAVWGGLFFCALTYMSLERVPSPLREIMTAITAIRYFSLFFFVGTYEYNKTVTNTARLNRKKPSLENKRAQLLHDIRQAERVIQYKLTDETIAGMGMAIFNAQ